MRGSGVEDQGGGCDVSRPHCLGSARQEVQDPITEGAVFVAPTTFKIQLTFKPLPVCSGAFGLFFFLSVKWLRKQAKRRRVRWLRGAADNYKM